MIARTADLKAYNSRCAADRVERGASNATGEIYARECNGKFRGFKERSPLPQRELCSREE
ncbi:MAG: hypothetical protein LBU73_02365 [Helicobacteraceae bacterium]|jgi:hypothetical protein|nr:hypothetical protein [Helicobacteraceae bacterium]